MRLLNGRYRVDERRPENRLGQGGAATVWRGEDTHLRQPVAIKLFSVSGTLTDEQDERFRAEASAAAGLRHPHIVQVTDYAVEQGQPFLVMELLEGGSLAQRLRQEWRAVRQESLQIGVALAEALDYAHARRHLHLDVKPGNVLFALPPANRTADPHQPIPKLSDFGAGRIMNAAGVSFQSTPLGTAAYTAPEQARGQLLDERTDIYALGIVLYQMLCGALPFPGETPELQIQQRLHSKPIPLHQRRPEIPPELCAIVERAIERVPARRWPSARELAEALRPFQQRSDGATVPTHQAGRRRTPTPPAVPRPSLYAPPAPRPATAPPATGAASMRPHALEDLARDVVVPGSGPHGAIYSHQGVHLHAHSSVAGTIFARGPVIVEAGCHIAGDIVSLTSIEMHGGAARTLCAPTISLAGPVVLEGALLCFRLAPPPGTAHLPEGSAIEGPVVLDPAYALTLEGVRGRPLQQGAVAPATRSSDPAAPLIVGSGCELSGIFGQASLVILPRVRRLDTIRVSGNVEVQGENWLHTVEADRVMLHAGSTVVYVAAGTQLTVASGATARIALATGDILVAGGGAVGEGIVLSERGVIDPAPGARWADGGPLTAAHCFLRATEPEAQAGALATRLLDHARLRAYHAIDPSAFPDLSLPPDEPEP